MDLLFQRFKKREKMTYHSKLQLGNDIAFKKTTIEQLIRQFDDSFSLSQPKQAEITNHDQSSNMEWLDYEQDNNQQESLINELHGEIEQLKAELQQAHDEITQLKNEKEKLINEQKQLETKLAEQVEYYTPFKEQQEMINKLFDEQGEYYAPDLAHALNLWLNLYGNGKNKNDSHSNMSDIWIKGNTGYQEQQVGYQRSYDRIREITTPFKEWSTHRNKNYKK